MKKINIVVCLHQKNDDSYIQSFAAMYASIRSHTKSNLVFYVVHDNSVSDKNIGLLSEYFGKKDEILFINVKNYPHIHKIGLDYVNNAYSPAVIWRVYLTDICPVEKVILLDVDLIFFCDIENIWSVDLVGKPIAACPRKKPWFREYLESINTLPENYFRIGLSVMNLDEMRKDEFFLKNRDVFLKEKLPEINKINNLPEQSFFNYFFSENYIRLSVELCRVPGRGNHEEIKKWLENINEFDNLVLDIKGWVNKTPFSYYYWCYLMQTPWKMQAYDWLQINKK